MNTETEEKKSSIKRIAVGILIAILIVAAIVFALYNPNSSLYVEVKYKTVGWYYTYPSSDNKTCLVLNLTITNKGYTDGVTVLPFDDFSLIISNVAYSTIIGAMIPNSSELLGHSYISPTLQSVTLMNGGSETGTIMFEFSKQLYNQPFTLQCSMNTTKSVAVSVRISKD
jgi:hypothetical protein